MDGCVAASVYPRGRLPRSRRLHHGPVGPDLPGGAGGCAHLYGSPILHPRLFEGRRAVAAEPAYDRRRRQNVFAVPCMTALVSYQHSR